MITSVQDVLLVLGSILGAAAIVYAVYRLVKLLIARHRLYEESKVLRYNLALLRTQLATRWEGFFISSRLKEITDPPPGMQKIAEKMRDDIEAELEVELRLTPARRLRTFLQEGRKNFLAKKPVRLKVAGPVDWPFWMIWQIVYGLYGLVNWTLYFLVLLWPTHTMRRLGLRVERLQELGQETSRAIKAAERLNRSAKFLSEKREKEMAEQAEAKAHAKEVFEKRTFLAEIRSKLVESLRYHVDCPASEILRGSALLNLEAVRRQWWEDLARYETFNPDDSELDGLISLWEEALTVLELVSVVEGTQPMSTIQRHAERLAESEKRIEDARASFRDKKNFTALGVSPDEPKQLRKAHGLLVEAAGYWAPLQFEKLTALAAAADELTRKGVNDIDDLKRWEDIIHAFDRKRADIKENEEALRAYGVSLPKTDEWKKAVAILENEVPRAWADYDWEKLNKLNTVVEEALVRRAQEVNRRLEVEQNKRKARGQSLPQGAKRYARAASAGESASTVSSVNGSDPRDTGKKTFRYAPDPRQMEPLVVVRSKVTRMLLQVRASLVNNKDYEKTDPGDPEVVEFLRSLGTTA